MIDIAFNSCNVNVIINSKFELIPTSSISISISKIKKKFVWKVLFIILHLVNFCLIICCIGTLMSAIYQSQQQLTGSRIFGTRIWLKCTNTCRSEVFVPRHTIAGRCRSLTRLRTFWNTVVFACCVYGSTDRFAGKLISNRCAEKTHLHVTSEITSDRYFIGSTGQ